MAGARVRHLAPLLLGATLMALAPSAAASSGPAVRGGGVVDGPPGTTSQLGFTATGSGGSFLCVMAGRSGGFPFGPWETIQQMQVQGRVTPGSLSITGDVATFSGTAKIHVVGTTATGRLAITMSDVPFVSTQAAGGAGVAWHLLEVSGVGSFGPAAMKTGQISIWP
jgi:hypothetical protein